MKKIELTQNQITLVDDEDFERLNQFKWCAHYNKHTKKFYAVRAKNKKLIRMHRFIMNCPDNKLVDHENHDTLLNCKYNLRIVTYSQNYMNMKSHKNSKSKYKGICWDKQMKKWKAQIQCNYRHIHIGLYKTEIEGAKAYNEKAKELFGTYAYLNEI